MAAVFKTPSFSVYFPFTNGLTLRETVDVLRVSVTSRSSDICFLDKPMKVVGSFKTDLWDVEVVAQTASRI
jgi:hypothetical protein